MFIVPDFIKLMRFLQPLKGWLPTELAPVNDAHKNSSSTAVEILILQ